MDSTTIPHNQTKMFSGQRKRMTDNEEVEDDSNISMKYINTVAVQSESEFTMHEEVEDDGGSSSAIFPLLTNTSPWREDDEERSLSDFSEDSLSSSELMYTCDCLHGK